MNSQDILSLAITSLVGLFVGGYLYVTGFAPQFLAHTVSTEDTYTDFLIAGSIYGGCQRNQSCRSFQIRSDGSFGYLAQSPTTAIPAHTGTLPSSYFESLRYEVMSTALDVASQKIEPTTCSSYIDGADFHYVITLNSNVYTLDTCGTNFNHDSALGKSLDNVWNYFKTLPS